MNAPNVKIAHLAPVTTIHSMVHSALQAYLKLIESGVISKDDFDQLASRHSDEANFEAALVAKGISLQQIGDAISSYYGIDYFNFDPDVHEKPTDLMGNIKKAFLQTTNWLPLEGTPAHRHVSVVCTDPSVARSSNPSPYMIYERELKWFVTTATEYDRYLDWLFDKAAPTSILPEDNTHIDEILSMLGGEDDDGDISSEAPEINEIEESEVVRVVNKTILDAYKRGVSDIHIEPTYRVGGKSSILIRFRQDGALIKYAEVPYRLRHALISRIKIQANLDIAERRLPQDGKIKMKAGSKEFELRVATCVTAGGKGGEDAVMRILAGSKPLPLDKMGFSKNNLLNLQREVGKPYGLFFVCGPTGSGKTTTLHSVLGYLNTPDSKILTVEDPVEITQDGLRQVQINPKAGLTFASVMRSFLRQDPDIIMVGEMRDQETIKTGIEASLTGHLVLSTLHTNSAAESIIRLLDMGVDPFNFADALLGVLPATQDEIKALIAEYCYELKPLPEFQKDYALAAKGVYQQWLNDFSIEGKLMLGHPKEGGCSKCCSTGFRGRVGLHELLIGEDSIKHAIQRGARPAEILEIAIRNGMRTLKQDGIEKVLQGRTAMSEIRKVCIK